MKNIHEMCAAELRQIAKKNNMVGAWKANKSQMIAFLESIGYNKPEEPIVEAAQNDPEETEEVVDDKNIVESEEATQNESEKNNGWEEIAKKNITNAYNWIVGENENTLQDYEEDSEQYKASYDYLHSGDEIMNDIYHEAITTEYGEGYCGGKAPKEMRFAGKKFCINLIRDLLKKDGYLKDEEPRSKKQDLIEYNGKTQSLSAWAKELGMPGQTLYARLRISNWPVEKAFTTPSRRKKTEE